MRMAARSGRRAYDVGAAATANETRIVVRGGLTCPEDKLSRDGKKEESIDAEYNK